jgi:hypothetical protein
MNFEQWREDLKQEQAAGEQERAQSEIIKLECTPWWRDPATIPRREFLYGRHLIRGAISATIGAGARAKTTHCLFEALEMVTGPQSHNRRAAATRPAARSLLECRGGPGRT